MRRFSTACMTEADQFLFLDSKANYHKLLKEMGTERGLFCAPEKLEEMGLEQLLCPSGRRHLHAYAELLQSSGSARVGAMSGSFVGDLSQNPLERRSRCGAWFPSLTRSSMISSVSKGAFFTNAELDFVMGFPSLPEQFPACAKYAEGLPPSLQVHSLPRNDYRKLIGNGQHVGAFFAFLIYIFGNIVKKSDVEQLCFPLPAAATTEGEEEGACSATFSQRQEEEG